MVHSILAGTTAINLIVGLAWLYTVWDGYQWTAELPGASLSVVGASGRLAIDVQWWTPRRQHATAFNNDPPDKVSSELLVGVNDTAAELSCARDLGPIQFDGTWMGDHGSYPGYRHSQAALSAPYLYWMAPFLAMWVVAMCWPLEQRGLLQQGLCERCGYDLRASPGACPECGGAGHCVGAA